MSTNGQQRRNEMKKDEKQLYAAFNCMDTEGGSFASSLACAWFRADATNKDKTQNTWPELTNKFLEKAKVQNG
jgi:hypothetical protein